ncbi:MAG: hypothetical protein HYV27_11230 [Candidatus Hydrogenedentes bacterium]|nr:hypothetical protein [Candidatus Hydrogenedentota bacterium]
MYLKTIITLAVSALVMVAIVLLAAYFGETARKEEPFDKGQRFTAKPGTTRENAVILTSTKRASGPEPIAVKAPVTMDDPPPQVMSLSRDSRYRKDAEPMEEHEVAIQAAESAATPEEGIAQIEEALRQPQRAEVAAKMEVALAELYRQSGPEGVEAARAAFERAMQIAPDQAAKDYVTAQYGNFLILQEDFEGAAQMLTGALNTETVLNPSRVQLAAQMGYLYEQRNDMKAAEDTYSKLFRDVIEKQPELGAEREEMLRLSAMKLSRLYRKLNRATEADEVAKLAHSIIGMQDVAAPAQ